MAAPDPDKQSARRFDVTNEQSSPPDKQTPTCLPRASVKPLKSRAECDPSPAESPRKTRYADEAAHHSAMPNLGETLVNCAVFNRGMPALLFAAGFGQFAVHVHQPTRTSALMQIVNILRAEKESIAELPLKIGKRHMRGIRIRFLTLRPSLGVELPHQCTDSVPAPRECKHPLRDAPPRDRQMHGKLAVRSPR